MISLQASEFFENIQNYHKDIDDIYETPSDVIPTLRSYQRRAVKWMVDREKNNDCKLIRNECFTFSFNMQLCSSG